MIGSGWTAQISAGSNHPFWRSLEIGSRCRWCIRELQSCRSRPTILRQSGQRQLARATASRSRGSRFRSAPVNMKTRTCTNTSSKSGAVKRERSFSRHSVRISLSLQSKTMSPDAGYHHTETYGCRKNMASPVQLRLHGRQTLRPKQDHTSVTSRHAS